MTRGKGLLLVIVLVAVGAAIAVYSANKSGGTLPGSSASPLSLDFCNDAHQTMSLSPRCQSDDHSLDGKLHDYELSVTGTNTAGYDPQATLTYEVGTQQSDGSYAYRALTCGGGSLSNQQRLSANGLSMYDAYYDNSIVDGYHATPGCAFFPADPNKPGSEGGSFAAPGNYRFRVSVVDPDGTVMQQATYDVSVAS